MLFRVPVETQVFTLAEPSPLLAKGWRFKPIPMLTSFEQRRTYLASAKGLPTFTFHDKKRVTWTNLFRIPSRFLGIENIFGNGSKMKMHKFYNQSGKVMFKNGSTALAESLEQWLFPFIALCCNLILKVNTSYYRLSWFCVRNVPVLLKIYDSTPGDLKNINYDAFENFNPFIWTWQILGRKKCLQGML